MKSISSVGLKYRQRHERPGKLKLFRAKVARQTTLLRPSAIMKVALVLSTLLLNTAVAWTTVSARAGGGRSTVATNLRHSAVVATNGDETIVLGKAVSHAHCTEPGDRDILVRAARGEITERTPVWLMRQAGRYMAAFREYSDRIPFRNRSETVETAVELSLQCHRAYGMDGIIMFSDILTPLPCLGIDFDVVKGTGPIISTKIRSQADVEGLPRLDFETKVPFIKDILGTLKEEAVAANTALIGFVGAPFTLASYTIEGKSSKHCETTNQLLLQDATGSNLCMSVFLDRLSNLIADYACYQIESGAEVIQIFESWAHQLSPQQFADYAKPAAIKVIQAIKAKHPTVPVIYFANGGSSYLELQRDMGCDMIAVDWGVDMAQARAILGPNVPVSGNVDPSILKFGTKEQIEQAVRDCIDKAGGPGNRHLLNLGHGVMQGTPECNVKYLVDECKRYKGKQ
jgi:uroporphyrinogen decarboxylase